MSTYALADGSPSPDPHSSLYVIDLTDGSTPGDMNCDGNIDFFDIDPFLLALFDAAGYTQAFPGCDVSTADANGDGAVDFFDIDAFVARLFGV